MKEYFICIAASALISAVCTALASGTGLARYVKYLCSLVCTAAIVIPLVSAVAAHRIELPESVPGVSYAPEYGGYFESAAYRSVKEYILSLSFEKTGITASDISIEINRNGGETVVGGLTVYIDPADSDRAAELKGALERELGGKVDVEVRDAAYDG